MAKIIQYTVWVYEEHEAELLAMYKAGKLVDYDWMDSYEEEDR